MRHTLLSIFVLAISLSVYAQSKQLSVDKFYAINGFSSTRLLLISNNSFFIAESNCTDASIARGKWTMENGLIRLLPFKRDSNFIRPKIMNGNLIADDTSLVFQIVDCFNKFVPKYSIILFEKNGNQQNCYADSVGIIKINKKEFKSFFTYNEMLEFDFRNNLDNYLHPIGNKTSSTIIQLNYPQEILNERPTVKSFEYNGAEFIKFKNTLKYKNSKVTLSKL